MPNLKYILGRVKNMDYSKFFRMIDYVHSVNHKAKIYIFLDMVYCALKYESGYMDYQLFEMFNMNDEERKTVVTRGKNNYLVKTYNDKQYIKYFHEKHLFNEKFDSYLNRKWCMIDGNNLEEFKEFLSGLDEVMLKPTDGTCGQKIEKVKTADFTAESLYQYMIDHNINLAEEVAVQCDEIAKLHPSSVNTVRIYTFKQKTILAFLRIGNFNNVVDNFNHGGLGAPIDVETGVINFPAVDKDHHTYTVHPLTNQQIVGFHVPNFEECKRVCEEASKVIPQVGYIAWDVCVGKDKPFLIEGNDFPGYDIYQLPAHRNDNYGLWPLFEKAMKED